MPSRLVSKLRYKILALIGLVLVAGLVALTLFFLHEQENTIIEQNQRALHKLTESVIRSMEVLMLEGHSTIMRDYASKLREAPDAIDFRVVRIDGTEAFKDNRTTLEVNRQLGERRFSVREETEPELVFPPGHKYFARARQGEEAVAYEEYSPTGQRMLTFLDPVLTQSRCGECHDRKEKVRGIIKVTTSLEPVDEAIRRERQQSFFVLAISIGLILLPMGYLMGRSVVRPIEEVTRAMAHVAGGHLDQTVPVRGQDEISHMAANFNEMAAELRLTHTGLQQEQDKLTTVILGSGEGIVVTGPDGQIVLVNPAAAELLGRDAGQIAREPLERLLGEPEFIRQRLADPEHKAEIVPYNHRYLLINAATIRNDAGQITGSAVLLRDVTDQQRLEDELRRQSTTDGLTGLYNRRFLDERIRYEYDRSLRYQQPLSVLMFDIDHFKRFNDEHGHERGDEVLRRVGATLKSTLREQDFPCRYGGEEFVGILPHTSSDAAAAVGERLRQIIAGLDIDGSRVTISLGLATLPMAAMDSPERLIKTADFALYEAKRDGRNRLVVARAVPTA